MDNHIAIMEKERGGYMRKWWMVFVALLIATGWLAISPFLIHTRVSRSYEYIVYGLVGVSLMLGYLVVAKKTEKIWLRSVSLLIFDFIFIAYIFFYNNALDCLRSIYRERIATTYKQQLYAYVMTAMPFDKIKYLVVGIIFGFLCCIFSSRKIQQLMKKGKTGLNLIKTSGLRKWKAMYSKIQVCVIDMPSREQQKEILNLLFVNYSTFYHIDGSRLFTCGFLEDGGLSLLKEIEERQTSVICVDMDCVSALNYSNKMRDEVRRVIDCLIDHNIKVVLYGSELKERFSFIYEEETTCFNGITAKYKDGTLVCTRE